MSSPLTASNKRTLQELGEEAIWLLAKFVWCMSDKPGTTGKVTDDVYDAAIRLLEESGVFTIVDKEGRRV